MRFLLTITASFLLLSASFAQAADKPLVENDFYKLIAFDIPKEIMLEAGGIELLANGRAAVSTRRGEVWMLDKPFAEPGAEGKVADAKWSRFAHGLHEVLGIVERDGWIYVTQRGEVSRLKDTDADGKADLFETVNDDWHIDGDYHEYAFGSRFDKDGNIWVVLCLTGSFSSNSKYRGWCLRISPDGKMIPTCSGVRSPGGIGMNALGEMFYTDNQGPWNGTGAL